MSTLGENGTPVTLLSGALGAGKTTTLNHLLSNPGDRQIAVLLNDMGALNIDAELVEAQGDGVAELSNGCICCDLRDDLEIAVSRLARTGEFDQLVVESSGISAPTPVARLFTTGPASAAYRLDTLVTVVDASDFRGTLANDDIVTTADIRRERPGQAETDGEVRPLSDLLVTQAEYADVLLVNKCDRANEATVAETETLLTALNPEAKQYRTTYGAIAPGRILDTGLFDPASLRESEHREQVLEHAADEHVHDPASAYGVTSFAFESRRPLHPGRFAAFLRSLPASVIRSKGLVWVAGRDQLALRYSGTGSVRRVVGREPWVAAMSERRQESQRRMRPDLPWDDDVGDRRTELVFIGREMDEDRLRRELVACERDDTSAPFECENPFPSEKGEEWVP